jgi:hypothetical protein
VAGPQTYPLYPIAMVHCDYKGEGGEDDLRSVSVENSVVTLLAAETALVVTSHPPI